MQPVNIFWFRRDLRLTDNTGLYYALKDINPVIPVFIFDAAILDELEDKHDSRVTFIHNALTGIQQQLIKLEATLDVRYGLPENIFSALLREYTIENVFANHDYEPYAVARDERVKAILHENNISFHTYKDQVIFEKDEAVKDNGEPYTVFTPYSRKWKSLLKEVYIKSYPVEQFFSNFYKQSSKPVPALGQIGFYETAAVFPSKNIDTKKLESYEKERDFPALQGTSRLSVHLRFGTVSIRKLVSRALESSDMFLNELIWREFYQCILWHFPQVVYQSFKPGYDKIKWRNNEKEFEAWCTGNTGYPIVDAGMRELNETGYMHNRVRMIVASFLTKHLLIDWRWGEAYFAKKLLDYDLAANNGGWQWAAGTGCDAAPYFRVFNPYLQAKKFDPALIYIRRWVPEFEELTYSQPVVDHEFARKRCLQVYAEALKRG
ncbi:deoxyribodipyrimidine photolyase [Terrimonas sp.]|uniref:cryptochrome/photolyase family protein n=1 Tax=Terrimonas sp. TaxID=1914338 RepID=UPI000D51936D|nr:deoxyribodipyrimidine photo-lyase [Terrimonas sp.]PVD53230.1 deoxyribodipyrimidine photolyase [Terrimonas sp.]